MRNWSTRPSRLSGEERTAPPLRAKPTPLWCAVLLHLVAGAPAAAQVAPVPSHAPSRWRAADSAIVARVNGVPIRAAELDVALNTVIPLNSYHQNVKPQKLAEMRTQALDGLIDEELRYQEAVRLKIQIPPAEIERALERARKTYPDRESFERARRASGATIPQLRTSIERALMIQKAYERVVLPACAVSEADAAAYYRDNRGRFMMPEQVRASLITIAVDPAAPAADWKRARQKTEAIARQIASGGSFEGLAREHSADPSKVKGGDLGFVHRGQLIDEFEQALSGLGAGQVSPVVQTIYGFHLLRLVEIRPAVQKTLAEVQATIMRDLTETRCKQASLAWSKRLRAAARVQIVDPAPARGRTTG
jgi:peptidyl-prolyl cis-trans isomerase C